MTRCSKRPITRHLKEPDHGIHQAGLAAGRADDISAETAHGTHEGVGPELGRERVRRAEDGAHHLSGEARGPLRARRRAGGDLDLRPVALGCRGLVGPADRLPEVHPVDGAARDDRHRRVLGAAGWQDQADDRGHPVLGTAGHDPAAAVAPGPVHRGRSAHLVRRGALPGPDRGRRRPAGAARRGHRFAVGGAAGQHLRAGGPGPAGPGDRAAGAQRAARQDDLPGCPG